MNKIYSSVVFLMIFLVTSCIPNKDLLYLQNKNNSDKETLINEVVNKPYRVQVNDLLSVRIKALDQKIVEIFNPSTTQGTNVNQADALYFEGFTVNDHGVIRVPVLGQVSVIGQTLDEIRINIEKLLLKEYFNKEAEIFVTINGEVTNPGTKTLLQEKVNILEAIANSGDITIVGNRKEVMVVRQYPNGTEIHTIDLTSTEAMKSPYYYVQPNDYIYIKPLKQKSWGFGTNGLQSFTTILTALSLVLTTFLLIKK
jgi:polysaccharide biosynthesis/export protein